MSLNVNENETASDKEKRFTLRMDSGLFQTISIIAKQHKRSIAKEIELAIECYVVTVLDKESGSQED